jgi:hypothetical protein
MGWGVAFVCEKRRGGPPAGAWPGAQTGPVRPPPHPTPPPFLAHPRRWYGSGEPRKVFVERKTHRESWKGEESVKERFTLDASQVVPFLEMEYDLSKVGARGGAAGARRGRGAAGARAAHADAACARGLAPGGRPFPTAAFLPPRPPPETGRRARGRRRRTCARLGSPRTRSRSSRCSSASAATRSTPSSCAPSSAPSTCAPPSRWASRRSRAPRRRRSRARRPPRRAAARGCMEEPAGWPGPSPPLGACRCAARGGAAYRPVHPPRARGRRPPPPSPDPL